MRKTAQRFVLIGFSALVTPSSLFASAGNAVDGITEVGEDIVNVTKGSKEWLEFVNDAVSQVGYEDSDSLDYVKPTHSAPDSGSLTVLSYNIKGFPDVIDGISDSEMRRVSQLVESWAVDIATIQEDWAKHKKFLSSLSMDNYPYRTKHFQGTALTFGDGLFIASRYPFDDNAASRTRWTECRGTIAEYISGNTDSPDCATEKGFSMARISIAGDFEIDVYTNHANTGGYTDVNGPNMRQLAAYINTWSLGRPIILTGDFNMQWRSSDRIILREFVDATGMRFICRDLNSCTSIDMIAYRGNDQWTLQGVSIEDIPGDNPSDHAPKLGVIEFQRNND